MSWRDEMYTANEKALQAEVRRLRNVVRDLEDQIDQLRKENPAWIPVSTGNFPKDEEKVLVTYLGYDDNKPYCDEFAYRYNGEWKFNAIGQATKDASIGDLANRYR